MAVGSPVSKPSVHIGADNGQQIRRFYQVSITANGSDYGYALTGLPENKGNMVEKMPMVYHPFRALYRYSKSLGSSDAANAMLTNLKDLQHFSQGLRGAVSGSSLTLLYYWLKSVIENMDHDDPPDIPP